MESCRLWLSSSMLSAAALKENWCARGEGGFRLLRRIDDAMPIWTTPGKGTAGFDLLRRALRPRRKSNSRSPSPRPPLPIVVTFLCARRLITSPLALRSTTASKHRILGLSIAERLVEAMNGSQGAERDGPTNVVSRVLFVVNHCPGRLRSNVTRDGRWAATTTLGDGVTVSIRDTMMLGASGPRPRCASGS